MRLRTTQQGCYPSPAKQTTPSKWTRQSALRHCRRSSRSPQHTAGVSESDSSLTATRDIDVPRIES